MRHPFATLQPMDQHISIALLNQLRQKPQPYQDRFLAALKSGDRLETLPERWDRERNKAMNRLVKTFVSIGFAARVTQTAMALFARQTLDTEHGSSIGRKVQINRQGGHHA